MTGIGNFKQAVPCHYQSLFVKFNGMVYPCCMAGSSDGTLGDTAHKIIGHVSDPDLPAKIEAYSSDCTCHQRRLRPIAPGEERRFGQLNLELSLHCQADCAMCCVFAPSFRGGYDLYDHLERLALACSPREMLFQGGEVLVQKRSLRFIERLRERLPDTRFRLTTNASVVLDLAETIERLFDDVNISVVGFQPETYRAIMGIDIRPMRRMARRLCRGGRTRVHLKFMATPNNIHELPLFLRWAARLSPNAISSDGIHIAKYVVRNTFDSYWAKIFERTGKEVRRFLDDHGREIAKRGVHLFFEPEVRELLGLDPPASAGLEAPDTPEYLLARAHRLILAGDAAGATSSLDTAVTLGLDPGEPRVRYLGALLKERDDQDSAVRDFKALLLEFPEHPDVLDHLDRLRDRAWGAMDSGDLAGARAILERVLQVRPRHAEARDAMAVSWLREGDHGRGLEVVRHGLELTPGQPVLMRILATLLAASGDSDAATAVLEELLEARPHMYSVLLNLSDIHRNAGRYGAARRCLDRARDMHPLCSGIESRRERIDRLAGPDPVQGA